MYNITIKIFGTNETEKEQIKNQFVWKNILASNNNFVINSPSNSVYEYYEDGNAIAAVSFAGNSISIHSGGHEDCKKIYKSLEKAVATYFDCKCFIATDFFDRPYQIELFKPNLIEHYGIKIGDHISFGQYRQGKDGELLPISWRVLNIDDEKAFLISDKCLIRSGYCDPKKADGKPWYLLWEFSMVREICNGDFYYQAFSDEERNYIIPKQVSSDNNPKKNTDFVFIPSEDEVSLFMLDNVDRQAIPTDYLTKSQEERSKVFLGFGDENEFTSWWLLPEHQEKMIYYPKAVWPNGEIQFHSRNVYHGDFTIRPCIVVKLSETFCKLLRHENAQPSNEEKGSKAFIESTNFKSQQQAEALSGEAYSLGYIKGYLNLSMERHPGARTSTYDSSLKKWRMRIQLDESGRWFLSVFRNEDGTLDKYSLDDECADDSHYEFVNEIGVRKKLCTIWNKNKYMAEIMIEYIKKHSASELLKQIYPFVTKEFHY